MKINRRFIITIALIFLCQLSFAQQRNDTLIVTNDSLPQIKTDQAATAKDTVVKKAHSPRKASLRSAIIPGWGQAYNKKYWKIPIVYAALGTTGYVFAYNIKTYRDLRFAYQAKFKAANGDSSDYNLIKPRYLPLDPETLRYYRNEYRRNIDYSVLVFVLFWGLNVVDATVDAHLKTFDVSPDLGFRFKAGYSDLAQTNGVSLILVLK